MEIVLEELFNFRETTQELIEYCQQKGSSSYFFASKSSSVLNTPFIEV